MKLVISEAIDRKKLILTIKNWLNISLRDTLLIINNLPYIKDNIYYPVNEIADMFNGIAFFSYEKDEEERAQDQFELVESQTYLAASSWFESLSDKEKEYFFLLSVGPT